MKLYGMSGSTCTRKVLTVLAEHNAPFEMVAIDLAKGEHKASPHLAHQPFGQIPAIDDDGFQMFESRAIIRYLDAKFGGSLTPTDLKARALMEQWISVETSNFTPSAMKLIYAYIMYPMRGQAVDPQMITDGTAGLEKVLPIMDAQLAKHAYIAGDQFTLADVGFLPYLEYLMMTPAAAIVQTFPNVMAWWTRPSARPSWRTAIGKA